MSAFVVTISHRVDRMVTLKLMGSGNKSSPAPAATVAAESPPTSGASSPLSNTSTLLDPEDLAVVSTSKVVESPPSSGCAVDNRLPVADGQADSSAPQLAVLPPAEPAAPRRGIPLFRTRTRYEDEQPSLSADSDSEADQADDDSGDLPSPSPSALLAGRSRDFGKPGGISEAGTLELYAGGAPLTRYAPAPVSVMGSAEDAISIDAEEDHRSLPSSGPKGLALKRFGRALAGLTLAVTKVRRTGKRKPGARSAARGPSASSRSGSSVAAGAAAGAERFSATADGSGGWPRLPLGRPAYRTTDYIVAPTHALGFGYSYAGSRADTLEGFADASDVDVCGGERVAGREWELQRPAPGKPEGVPSEEVLETDPEALQRLWNAVREANQRWAYAVDDEGKEEGR